LKMSTDIIKSNVYANWFKEIKDKVRSTQIKAAVAVNQSLHSLHRDIGKMIVEMQEKSGWGNAVVERLSKDLRKEFPDMKGFSRANLFFMRQWFLFYCKTDPKVQRLVRQIPWGHNVSLS
jgi:predicted nuclease of restriction endonuclease-like (RecB) superfamily